MAETVILALGLEAKYLTEGIFPFQLKRDWEDWNSAVNSKASRVTRIFWRSTNSQESAEALSQW